MRQEAIRSRRVDLGSWMRENLTTQGYRLSDEERGELALGLRFSTGLCLSLVVVAHEEASDEHPGPPARHQRARVARQGHVPQHSSEPA